MTRPLMPLLCTYHASIYATRMQKLRRRFRYPGSGRKALASEATLIAKACPWCPYPPA